MKIFRKGTVHTMTDKQLKVLLKSIQIIVRLSEDKETIKNALEELQDVCDKPSSNHYKA